MGRNRMQSKICSIDLYFIFNPDIEGLVLTNHCFLQWSNPWTFITKLAMYHESGLIDVAICEWSVHARTLWVSAYSETIKMFPFALYQPTIPFLSHDCSRLLECPCSPTCSSPILQLSISHLVVLSHLVHLVSCLSLTIFRLQALVFFIITSQSTYHYAHILHFYITYLCLGYYSSRPSRSRIWWVHLIR